MSFQNLSFEAQAYINSRFQYYNLEGEEAYEVLLSEEAKSLDSDDLIALLQEKDISHIVAQSEAPDLANRLDNIFLEDSNLNRARGARLSSEEEINNAWEDQISDAEIFLEEENTWEGIVHNIDDGLWEEVLGASVGIGILISAYTTRKAYQDNRIQLNEMPQYFTQEWGGRTVKVALIGFGLSSSMPIIVGATSAYLIYRNRSLLAKVNRKTRPFMSKIIDKGHLSQTALKAKEGFNYFRNKFAILKP